MAALHYYHAPQSRSTGVAILLAELDAPHQIHVLNMKAGEQREPAFLSVNPLGKVPAIVYGDALVTEQVAIFIYLADLFPAAGLAPLIEDPLRGAYLRWMAFHGSCFEPAIIDHALKREAAPPTMSPYGSYQQVIDTVAAQLRRAPYLLGDRFSAADILWGTSLRWTTMFGIVPLLPEIESYIGRVTSRPSVRDADERDAVWAAQHAELVAKG